VAAAAAADPAAPRAGTRAAAAAAAAATAAKPPRQQQQQQQRRGRNPFASAVLNTYALPGTEHATWRRWLLELGLFLGWALAALGPAVGLAVMTPYISVTSGLASDLRKDAECLKVAPEVSERDAKERRGGGREGGGREGASDVVGRSPSVSRAGTPGAKKKKGCFYLFPLSPLPSLSSATTFSQACPVPLQFDYYFWNVTNPQAVRFLLCFWGVRVSARELFSFGMSPLGKG
jgi:hypothetical protein